MIGMLGTLSYMYLFYFLFIRNKGNLPLKILACVGFLIIRGGLEGNIAPFVHLGLILFFFNLQKERILVIPAIILILGIFIYQPMKGFVRPLITETSVGTVESFSIGFDQIVGQDFIAIIDVASHRLDHNELLSSFVEHIGSDDYIKWKAYENLWYAPIPRFLWPGKPKENFGNEWAVQEGYLNKDDRITSFNLPWLPQMYLSYGPAGILIGSFVVLIILFFLSRFYWYNPRSPWDYSMGLVALLCMFSLDSDFSISFGILTKFIIVDLTVRFFRKVINFERNKES